VPGLAPPQQFPLPANLNHKLFQFSFNALPGLPEILTQGREREFMDWLFDIKAVHPGRITEESRSYYTRSYARPRAMGRGFEYYRAASSSAEQNISLNKQFGKLEMPVLGLGGSSGV
jgi:hypothetical protein